MSHSAKPRSHTEVHSRLSAQIMLAQSPSSSQSSPPRHPLQSPPPQSSPVSAPFLTLSLHDAGWQMESVHTPLSQPAASTHGESAGHGAQSPPQSIAISPGSSISFPQDSPRHTFSRH